MPLASILGGIMGQSGANAAGAASAAAGGQALSNSYDVGNRDVARLSPWQASGAAAAQQINALLGLGTLGPIGDQYNTYGTTADPNAQAEAAAKFKTDPGYTFQLQQGINALDRGAAAKGMVLSGAQQKGVSDYGQNTGATAYNNYFNRLMGVSGQGMTAAGGQNTAYNQALVPGISQNFQGAMTNASDQMAGTNALISGINSGVSNGLSLVGYTGLGKNSLSKVFT